ncbi:MAG: hypothetical protein ABW321_32590 [Polyangiales bacterium]
MTTHEPDLSSGGWACFPNAVPSREIVDGLRALGALPRGALQNLWPLLWMGLRDSPTEQTDEALQVFCQRFATHPAGVLAAIRTCDFLLRQAAALGVGRDAFAADVRRLLGPGEDRSALELLLNQFDEATHYLRRALLEATLADHGQVLTAFDWRVDRVKLSSRGLLAEAEVLLLNLRYRKQDKDEQLSLQLTPDAVAALRALLDQLGAA